MKKKLGKLTALWLCWELWDWLAKNPGRRKSEWPGWTINGGQVEPVEAFCFACSYALQRGLSSCNEDCIIPVFRYKTYGCEDEASPYRRWHPDEFNSEKYARIIADSAYEEYKRLGGKRVK